MAPGTVAHLFDFLKHPTQLTVHDRWDQPADAADFIYFITYADDVAIDGTSANVTSSYLTKKLAISAFISRSKKTKLQNLGSESCIQPVHVNGQFMEPITEFTYPGNIQHSNGRS